MDKSERETHDFMNVESFSQLPFIRPAPAVKEKGIRLFGIEFGNGNGGADASASAAAGAATDESESVETNLCDQDMNIKDNENGDSGRRFECHYCCRNFPTSQALGGHQNAHKRERQHAKRAHLQSAMVHAGTLSDPHHVYGAFMNYHRPLPSSSTSTYNHLHHSWNNNISAASNSSTSRYYPSSHASSFSHHHQQQQPPPINGSPLGLWRIPSVHHQGNTVSFSRGERVVNPLPLFSVDDMKPTVQIGGSSTSQSRFIYDSKPNVQDHVSLDLHL